VQLDPVRAFETRFGIDDELGLDFRIWIADFGFKVFYLFY